MKKFYFILLIVFQFFSENESISNERINEDLEDVIVSLAEQSVSRANQTLRERGNGTRK